jgi:hypothetical protein
MARYGSVTMLVAAQNLMHSEPIVEKDTNGQTDELGIL